MKRWMTQRYLIILISICFGLLMAGCNKQKTEVNDVVKNEITKNITATFGVRDIQGIEFSKTKDEHLLMQLELPKGVKIIKSLSENGDLYFRMKGVNLPSAYAKEYRLEKFSTEVISATFKQDQLGTEILVKLDKIVETKIFTKGVYTIIEFATHSKQISLNSGLQKATEIKEAQSQRIASKDSEVLFPGMKEKYTGEKISIDVQNAELEHVLRLIGEVSGYNLILDDSVKGTVSLKLSNVPWDLALDMVLLQKNLGMIKRDNIIRIASAAKITQEQQEIENARAAAIKSRDSLKELVPLHTEFLQINYAKPSEMVATIKAFMTPRGVASFDTRTNSLIVTDTAESLAKLKNVVTRLDKPERQVLIEARIVYATNDFQRSLGLSWSGSITDQSTLPVVLNTINPDGSITQADKAVNYPKNIITASGLNMPAKASGITLGGLLTRLWGGDLYTLDAKLMLGESTGTAKTISSPRVVTLNNEEASIEQGVKVQTQGESSSGGVTTNYDTEAVLKIVVKPHITPDDKLLMDIDITDDSLDANNNIAKKHAKTKLLVENGQTLVLGGVQKIEEGVAENKIPVLGDIPLLGWLFKARVNYTTRQELLIFINPKIL